MKRTYHSPVVRKINYSFDEHLTAESWPVSGFADPWKHRVCTWGDGTCSDVFNVMARGINDCIIQGKPELLDPYE